MTNADYNTLKAAHDTLLSPDNMAELDKLKTKVVSSKIEKHPKYGWQCVVILQPAGNNTIK